MCGWHLLHMLTDRNGIGRQQGALQQRTPADLDVLAEEVARKALQRLL